VTDNQIILPLEEEATNLELHTKLCAQRYQQLINKLDFVDHRLDRLENHIVDIKDSIVSLGSKTSDTYLKWAGVIILTLLGIITHFILK